MQQEFRLETFLLYKGRIEIITTPRINKDGKVDDADKTALSPTLLKCIK
jgi:hypothetical protein